MSPRIPTVKTHRDNLRRRSQGSLVVFACVLAFAGLASDTGAKELYSDRFELRPGDKPGVGIENRKLDAGDGRWITARSTDPVLTPRSTVTVRNQTSAAQGMVAIKPFSKEITVRARVRPFTSDWIAIGLLSDANRPNWFSEVNQVWLYLKPSGQGHLMSRGTKSIGHRRPPPDFDSTGFHILELSYDSERNALTASVDGVPVRAPVELGLFVPKISAVGFRINRDADAMLEAGEPQVDWIEVSTD